MSAGARGGPGERIIRRVSDFQEPDMAWVGTVRSPASRGRLASISIPHLPREFRSITADDIPGRRTLGESDPPIPILASGSVSYRGEPVALIVGPDRARVSEAVRLARVAVEESPARYSFERFDSSRILASGRVARGDVDKAFADAFRIVEGEYRMPPQDHYYPEPQGAAAMFDYDKLMVYASTQWPFNMRDEVAAALAVKQAEVVVQPTLLGPHLDGKIWYPSLLACHAALAALVCGRPALLLLTREEDFLYTTKRAPFIGSLRAGLDASGSLVALEARLAFNLGAYGPLAGDIVARAAESLGGGYACPALRISSWAVRSDLPPMGAFAGIGTESVNFARERLAEDCALAMDADPSAWRSANAASRGDPGAGTPLKRRVPYDQVAERLLAISDYGRKRSSCELLRKRRDDPAVPPGSGVGLAFSAQLPPGAGDPALSGPAAQPATVEVELSKNSTLTIRASSIPGARGTALAWKAAAADIIGLDPSDVSLEEVRTDRVPDSGPAILSRGVAITTKLIVDACEGIRTKRFREALPITVRKTYRPRARKESPLDGASWAGAVVELRLDPLDGAPVVKGAWLVVKAGRILMPEKARRALERDAARALGQCLAERLDLGSGPADHGIYVSYRVARLKDAPPIEVQLIEDDEAAAPLGIGELAYATIPAAFANAMSQALDRPWNSLPGTAAARAEGSAGP